MARKPVSQSRTMWVKKGTVVDGKKVKKGYVAQKGRPEKRVTARVKLETDTAKRGKKGDVVKVTKGRYKKSPSTAGGGVTKAQAAAAARAPRTSYGPAKTSSGGRVNEVNKLPKSYGSGVDTSSIAGLSRASGARFQTSQPKAPERRADRTGSQMSASRRAYAERTARARGRQGAAKKAAAYGVGLANPATRGPAFLAGAAEAGYRIGSSARGKKAGKSLKKIAGIPGRWLQGY